MAVALAYAGRTTDAIRYLDEAESITPASARPRFLLRRAHALMVNGAYEQALVDATESIRGSHRRGDALWEARGVNNRAHVHLALGHATHAERDAKRAEQMLTAIGQELEAVQAIHNRAHAAELRGNLPQALALIDSTGEAYRRLGARQSDFDIDRARMYLNAGLASEALAACHDALQEIYLRPVKRAELLLTAAQAALAEGDLRTAGVDGDLAGRLFASQQRPAWAHRAQLLALQAQYLAYRAEMRDVAASTSAASAVDPVRRRAGRRLLRFSAVLVEQMRAERAADLSVAELLHGRIAHDAGHDDDARLSFSNAAAERNIAPGLARAAGWLAAALLADLENDRRGLLRACRRGLDAVDEHRALLGDLELRALASRHGNELATMAFRSKVVEGDSRGMLWWVERWRATGLGVTPVRPSLDSALERDLAALRNVARRLETTPENDPQAPLLRQERQRREATVRGAYRRQRGKGETSPGFDLRRVIDLLGDRQLIALVQDQEQLHSLVVRDGRVRRRPILGTSEALREAHFARFALRRAAFGRSPDLAAVGRRLEQSLLGATRDLADREHTVIVPPSTLLTAPWGLLPTFQDRSITVVPSATMWATATSRPARPGHIALVTGPELTTGEAEVTALSPLHDDARAIAGDGATVTAALGLLDGARLAHIAAHGTFRADAPLFSSLKLADGPLTMHDLGRLARPPRAMVLSACDSGNAAPIGAYEALGLVSSLLAMGTSSVLASVVPVNDLATIGIMRHVHDVAGQGGSLSAGWLAARQAASDPLERATAAAFTAWGA
jgi:hypothetical protein